MLQVKQRTSREVYVEYYQRYCIIRTKDLFHARMKWRSYRENFLLIACATAGALKPLNIRSCPIKATHQRHLHRARCLQHPQHIRTAPTIHRPMGILRHLGHIHIPRARIKPVCKVMAGRTHTATFRSRTHRCRRCSSKRLCSTFRERQRHQWRHAHRRCLGRCHSGRPHSRRTHRVMRGKLHLRCTVVGEQVDVSPI